MIVKRHGHELRDGARIYVTGRWTALSDVQQNGSHFRATTDDGGALMGNASSLYAVELADPQAPPVHGPGTPEQFGVLAPSTDTLLDRGRRAILRAENLRRRVSQTVQPMPPAGTLRV